MAGAKDRLENAEDVQTKREVLSLFGIEHQLKDKKFNLVPEVWMLPVLTKYKSIERKIDRLEPIENALTAGQNTLFSSAIPLMRGLVDEVWTRYLESRSANQL